MTDNRKTIAITKKDLAQNLVSGWISTEKTDMFGDVVLASGLDSSYYDRENTRTLTLYHDPTKPCGKCGELSIRPGKGIWAKYRLGTKSHWAREARAMLDDDILNSMSIEWDGATLVSSPPTPAEKDYMGDDCRRVFRSWTLTGVSLVCQPMNADCGLTEKQLSRLTELVALGTVSRATAKLVGDLPPRKHFVMNVTPPRPKLVVIPGLGVVAPSPVVV